MSDFHLSQKFVDIRNSITSQVVRVVKTPTKALDHLGPDQADLIGKELVSLKAEANMVLNPDLFNTSSDQADQSSNQSPLLDQYKEATLSLAKLKDCTDK